MQTFLVLFGLTAVGGGCFLLGTRRGGHIGRPAAIGLAASGFVVASSAVLLAGGGDSKADGVDGSEDNDTSDEVEGSDPDPSDRSTSSGPPVTGTTTGAEPPEQATTTAELGLGTTVPAAEPENISIIPECFDLHHGEEPAVTAHDYRLAVDNDEERTSEPIPSGRPAALFVVDDGAVVGSVRFEYSSNDTLTVYDAVDERCEPVPWEQTSTELRSSTIAVAFDEETQYEVTFAFGSSFRDRTATIHSLNREAQLRQYNISASQQGQPEISR